MIYTLRLLALFQTKDMSGKNLPVSSLDIVEVFRSRWRSISMLTSYLCFS